MSPASVLEFWFSEAMQKRWFRSTPDFDAEVRDRFLSTWEQARAGRILAWENSADGALALTIVLDQFPLNMFRDQPAGYATEALARAVADRAIDRGHDQELQPVRKAFLYMPFMHSEDILDQERSVALFQSAGLEDNLRFARHHREIVRRFGRFPHRNKALGRESTADELTWLASAAGFKP